MTQENADAAADTESASVTNIGDRKKKTVTRGKAKAKPTKAAQKVAKAKKVTAAPCACLCGDTAKGGGFVPGHDSRLAGAMKRIVGGKPYEGERDYVRKVIKSNHPALISKHFVHLIEKVQKAG